MSHVIEKNRLKGAPFVPATLSGPIIVPELLVIHYTATLAGKTVVQAFAASGAAASAHLVVDIDGSMTQMVDFNRRAAHAGKSTWRGRPACNGFSIGIELVNPGPLYQTEEGFVETVRRHPWPGGVVHAKHKNGGPFIHWAAYSEPQLAAVTEVSELLVKTYGLVDVVGHDDVSPGRKIDPGPAFPLASLRGGLAERDIDGANDWVTTTVLNVREGAGTQFQKVAGSPLAPKTIVEVVTTEGPWSLVRTSDAKVEGWVFSRHLANQ